jgi:hypothetical protein
MPTKTPPDYVPRYTQKEVKRRYLYLSERCWVLLNGMMQRHTTWKLNFDPLVMANIAVSTMDDIWRWKVYHLRDGTKRSDAIKRAAFFTKWILRLRPIHFENRPLKSIDFIANFDKDDSTLLINELFALHVALASVATDAGLKKIILTDALTADLLYDFHYRSLNDDALMQIYSILRTIGKKQQVLMP